MYKKNEFKVRPRTRSEQGKYWAGVVISCMKTPLTNGCQAGQKTEEESGEGVYFWSSSLSLSQLFGDT